MDFFAKHKSISFPIAALVALIFVELLWQYDIFDRRMALVLTAFLAGLIYLTIYFVISKKFKIILPAFTAWVLFLTVLLDAMGNFLHYYGTLGWWDDFTHFAGTAAIAIIVLSILYLLNVNKVIKIGKFGLILSTYAISIFLTSFYEVTEYWGDLITESRRIGDRYDTVSDLSWNLLGVTLVVIASFIFFRKKKIR